MQNQITPAEGQELDLSTSEGGRGYIADLFRTRLKRHDFTAYINERLAADFACALSRYLKPIHWELERYRLVGCTSCDGSGHLHSIIGDYHGPCVSCAAYELEQAQRTVGSLMHERDTLRNELAELRRWEATVRDGSELLHLKELAEQERDALRKKLDDFAYDEEREWDRYVAACAAVGVKAARNEHGSPVEANGIFAGWQGWSACAKLRAKEMPQ